MTTQASQSSEPPETPAAQWRAQGEPDPHGSRYDCERAALTMGDLTDDELANGAFMNYDVRPNFQDIIDGKPGVHMPIVWMTAVKDRIRWLSRSLEKAIAAQTAQQPLSEAERAELETYRRVLAGLPEGAIDGGWTAAGICAYAKSLEAKTAQAVPVAYEIKYEYLASECWIGLQKKPTQKWAKNTNVSYFADWEPEDCGYRNKVVRPLYAAPPQAIAAVTDEQAWELAQKVAQYRHDKSFIYFNKENAADFARALLAHAAPAQGEKQHG